MDDRPEPHAPHLLDREPDERQPGTLGLRKKPSELEDDRALVFVENLDAQEDPERHDHDDEQRDALDGSDRTIHADLRESSRGLTESPPRPRSGREPPRPAPSHPCVRARVPWASRTPRARTP